MTDFTREESWVQHVSDNIPETEKGLLPEYIIALHEAVKLIETCIASKKIMEVKIMKQELRRAAMLVGRVERSLL